MTATIGVAIAALYVATLVLGMVFPLISVLVKLRICGTQLLIIVIWVFFQTYFQASVPERQFANRLSNY